MMTKQVKRLRPRHDGWTPERRLRFCAELARTGCVTDACRAVGMSTTNAYRTYDRLPEFRQQWDEALATPRPILEQAAFERAVYGVEVGIHRNGQVVATHRKYSDGLLRYLLEREERRREHVAKRKPWEKPERPIEEIQADILRRIELVEQLPPGADVEAALAALPPMDRSDRDRAP